MHDFINSFLYFRFPYLCELFSNKSERLSPFSVIIELHSTILHIYGATVFRLVNDIRGTFILCIFLGLSLVYF